VWDEHGHDLGRLVPYEQPFGVQFEFILDWDDSQPFKFGAKFPMRADEDDFNLPAGLVPR
jgi:hypothetical protein